MGNSTVVSRMLAEVAHDDRSKCGMTQRQVERARLRGGARAVLRELQLELNQLDDPDMRAVVIEGMRTARAELAAALR